MSINGIEQTNGEVTSMTQFAAHPDRYPDTCQRERVAEVAMGVGTLY